MELIDREELLKDLKTSAIYHANNSREETLMYRDRNIVREQPTVEAIPKADYEARLRADMVAILKEMRAEMEYVEPHDMGEIIILNACKQVVDTRINSLKEQEDGNK